MVDGEERDPLNLDPVSRNDAAEEKEASDGGSLSDSTEVVVPAKKKVRFAAQLQATSASSGAIDLDSD